jgi:hypothetical protein
MASHIFQFCLDLEEIVKVLVFKLLLYSFYRISGKKMARREANFNKIIISVTNLFVK